jgi:hypothetical protein
MKKNKSEINDWLRDEYRRSDFGKLTRGKYAKRMRESTNLVLLEPEVAKVFQSGDMVNDALRQLIEIARASVQRGNSGKKQTRTARIRVSRHAPNDANAARLPHLIAIAGRAKKR